MDKQIFHDSQTERPERSCEVFIISQSGYMSSVNYNKKADAFNCSDPNDTSCAFKHVLVWAYKEDVYRLAESQTAVDIEKEIAKYYDYSSWD